MAIKEIKNPCTEYVEYPYFQLEIVISFWVHLCIVPQSVCEIVITSTDSFIKGADATFEILETYCFTELKILLTIGVLTFEK